MSADDRRRRRRDDDSDRGGLPLFPLLLVVVLAGLLLGGVLARFIGAPKGTPPVNAAVAAIPSPTETPTPRIVPIDAKIRTPAPKATPTPAASATPTGSASPAPSTTPSLRPTAPSTPVKVSRPLRVASSAPPRSPSPSPAPTLRARVAYAKAMPTPSPTPTPAAVTPDDVASSLVRSYLNAVARGDRAVAASYLAGGLPTETWLNTESRIESIHSAAIGPQRYRVSADIVQTNGVEYYETFTVEQSAGGLQITDHYVIKPQ